MFKQNNIKSPIPRQKSQNPLSNVNEGENIRVYLRMRPFNEREKLDDSNCTNFSYY